VEASILAIFSTRRLVINIYSKSLLGDISYGLGFPFEIPDEEDEVAPKTAEYAHMKASFQYPLQLQPGNNRPPQSTES
jgi:hypothetical protein